jgi:hypothetical protein
MRAGSVNASARNTTSGHSSCTDGMTHAQNASGFVCGLSTRKIRTPRRAQVANTSRQAAHNSRRSSSRSGQKRIG